MDGHLQEHVRSRLVARALLAALIALIALSVAAIAKGGAPGPLGGQLVYASNRSPALRQPQVMQVTAGRRPRALAVSAPVPDAVLSPSGRQFAWVSAGTIAVGRLGAARAVFAAPNIVGGSAIWFPDGRRIAFTREQTTTCLNRPGECPNPELWAVGATGSGLRLLAEHASEAVWSANSRRIAYSGNVAGSSPRISILDTLTGSRNVLPIDGQPLSFSPSGDWLAYLRNQDVYLIAADGSGKRDIGAFNLARWSPDSRELALVREGYPSRVVIANGDGRQQSLLRLRGSWDVEQIAWRADGRALAAVVRSRGGAVSIRTITVPGGRSGVLVRSRPRVVIGTISFAAQGGSLTYTESLTNSPHDLWLVDAGTTDSRRLTEDGLDELEPTVSPNGRLIALTVRGPNGETWLATMPIFGSKPGRLPVGRGADRDPTWAPDGLHIAFTRVRANGSGQIWTIAADGSDPQLLLAGSSPTAGVSQPDFSPDGTRIAYVCALQLCIAKADGSEQQQVSEETPVSWPTWSPDSRHLAFIDSRGLTSLDTTTGATRVLVPPAAGVNPVDSQTRLSWSPDGNWIAFGRLIVPPDRLGLVAEVAYARADGSNSLNAGFSGPGDSIDPSWFP